MRHYNLLLAVLVLFVLQSCGKDNKEDKLTIPSTYKFDREGKSSVGVSGQWTRIDMHSAVKAYAGSAKKQDISAEVLLNMMQNKNQPFSSDGAFFSSSDLNSSTKQIWNKMSASAANKADQSATHGVFRQLMAGLEQLSKARNDEAAKGKAGIAGGKRLVDEVGIEYDQVLSKGLMGAMQLDQMLNNYLSSSRLNVENDKVVEGKTYTKMEHHWDEAFGYTGLPLDPSLDYSDKTSENGKKYRRFWSGYINSVNSSTAGKGIKKQIYDAFLAGRTAIVNKDYTERDKQAQIVKDLMAKVCAIRCVHYFRETASLLAKSPGAVNAEAFHDGSEGLGFLIALGFIDHSHSAFKTVRDLNENSDIFTKGFYEESSVEDLRTMANTIAGAFGFKAEDA